MSYSNDQGVQLNTAAQISAFKQSHPDWESQIESLAEDRIFILREGHLETYLGIGKDLRNVIQFCQQDLSSFLTDETSTKSLEMRSIIDAIASNN